MGNDTCTTLVPLLDALRRFTYRRLSFTCLGLLASSFSSIHLPQLPLSPLAFLASQAADEHARRLHHPPPALLSQPQPSIILCSVSPAANPAHQLPFTAWLALPPCLVTLKPLPRSGPPPPAAILLRPKDTKNYSKGQTLTLSPFALPPTASSATRRP